MAAQAQITVEPYSGEGNESFRKFEQLFRGFVGLAAAQQAKFLQFYLRSSLMMLSDTSLSKQELCGPEPPFLQRPNSRNTCTQSRKAEIRHEDGHARKLSGNSANQSCTSIPDYKSPSSRANRPSSCRSGDRTKPFCHRNSTKSRKITSIRRLQEPQVRRIFMKAMPELVALN